jgi:hypothetical protein
MNKIKLPKLKKPELKAPKMTRPAIKAPKIKAPKIKAPGIKAPQFLSNLYRDMRDRRLLVPAAALVAALIAVPIVLSSSSSTTTPTPAAATIAGESGDEAATSPAVLTEQLGVTDYRKRLEQLNSKNPFRRQFMTTPKSAGSQTTSSDPASSTATSSTSVPSVPSTSSSAPIPPTSSSDVPPSSAPPQPPEPTLYAFRADVAIGPPGDLTRRKDVELGKFLPGEGKPMVAFAGATEDLKHGLFLVSDDVSSVSGDGRCVPGPIECSLLRLKVGDQATMAYTPEGDRTYRLKLFRIDLAPVDAASAGKRAKRASPYALAAQG